ncbi:MAG TPA: pantetheine-phosphate adenylyltransferase [Rhodospirillaceae bacterium]|nr:pantetheine-phosphate adenylyltransferase [Rhodospirillaceae bacterium]
MKKASTKKSAAKKTGAQKPRAQKQRLTGVYPGTFDPVTLGHLDIIERALKVVDHLVVAVADNPGKGPLFNTEERVKMMETDLANNPKIKGKSWEVVPFSKLLMQFVEEVEARVIVRGLRAVSDFEYEFQMAGMNAYLNKDIETMFLMSQDKFQFVSSRFVKEIGRLGGDISHFVTPSVGKALQKRFKKTG